MFGPRSKKIRWSRQWDGTALCIINLNGHSWMETASCEEMFSFPITTEKTGVRGVSGP